MKRARRDQKLKEAFEKHIQQIVPLADQLNTRDDLPKMVNVVATVEMFPAGSKYRFPLEAIAAQIGANVQYGPLKFAADILRLRDRTSDSTALVFRSGKLVIVHCLSWDHSRFCCHLYRLLLERVQCVMRDPDNGNRLVLTTLEGRTQFNNWKVHNTVGFGQLGCRVDLNALRKAAPHVCQYKPDIFPGLKLRVWIKPPEECTCGTLKCPCKVKMLIFDNGNVIIVGARSIKHINEVFYRFKALVPRFEDYTAELPRHMRFESRMARVLATQNVGVSLDNVSIVPKRVKNSNEDDKEMLSIMCVLDGDDGDDVVVPVNDTTFVKKQRAEDNMSNFIKACVLGQESNVRWMLSINRVDHIAERDTQSGKTAVELINDIPEAQQTEQHHNILEMLVRE